MNKLWLMVLMICFGLAGAAMVGCEEEKSPLEKAAENTGDAMKKAADSAADDLEEAAKELEDKANE